MSGIKERDLYENNHKIILNSEKAYRTQYFNMKYIPKVVIVVFALIFNTFAIDDIVSNEEIQLLHQKMCGKFLLYLFS